MELPFEVLDQSQLDAERAKLNKNIQNLKLEKKSN